MQYPLHGSGVHVRLLWVVPVLLFVFSTLTTSGRGPYYWRQNFDPEYCYLFNAVNLLTFEAPGHTDHPGTTLQELGAAVILVRWWAASLVSPWQPVDRAVLEQPEDYLHTINLVLNLLFCGLVAWAGLRVLRATGSPLPALAFQASFLLFDEVLLAQTRVSPEPLLMAVMAALAGVMAPLLFGGYGDAGRSGAVNPVLAGAIFGFGLVTKITFLPVAVLAWLIPEWKARLRFAGGALLAAAVLLLPIYSQLPRVAGWLWSLVTHQERYGLGKEGAPPAAVLIDNAYRLYQEDPYLYLSAVFFAVVLGLLLWRGDRIAGPGYRRLRRILLVSMLGVGLSVAMTVKHYASHYALPAMLLVPVIMAALVAGVESVRPPARPARRLAGGVLATTLALALLWTARPVPDWFISLVSTREEHYALERFLGTMADCTVVGMYRCSRQEFALHFGNNAARNRRARLLTRLHPGAIHYQVFVKPARFENFSHEKQDATIARRLASGACVLLQGERESITRLTDLAYERVGPDGREIAVKLRPPSEP